MTPTARSENEPQPTAAARQCPNCPAEVSPGGRGMGRMFCSPACQRAWNARNKARGSVMAPMILAFAAAGRAKPGTPEAEVGRIARREMMTMARTFLREDRDAGRPSPLPWAHRLLIEQGSRYQDRSRK